MEGNERQSASSIYRETRVKTASPAQLVVMLYDEAVKQCDIAIGLMKSDPKKCPQNIEKINRALGKVQDIVTELMAGLDFDVGGDIADDLFALYVWFGRQLLDANLKKDVTAVETIRKMLDDLRGAWTEAAIKVQSSMDIPSSNAGVNIAG